MTDQAANPSAAERLPAEAPEAATVPVPDAPRTIGQKLQHLWRQHIRPLLIILLVLTAFRSTVADWSDVPTGSMKPSIIEGDRIFVNKLAFGLKIPFTTIHLARWSDPKRGDIVVFFSPKDGTRLVKRVVGLPGDTIEIYRNAVMINGQQAEYEPLDEAIINAVPTGERNQHRYFSEVIDGQSHPIMASPHRATRSYEPPLLVPPGHYYMLGDNRDNSADSRYIGPVPQKNILGRSSMVVFSLNYDNHYIPRGSRFFKYLP